MTERTYTHTFDMDRLVQTAVEYEDVIRRAGDVIGPLNPFDAADSKALEVASLASDALSATREMFEAVLPPEVFSDFQNELGKAMETADA